MTTPNDADTAPGRPRAAGGGERPTPEPMEVNDVLIVAIGTALFAVAFVVLFVMRDSLDKAGHERWPWIALSGTLLGLVGLVYCQRRARRIGRGAASDAPSA